MAVFPTSLLFFVVSKLFQILPLLRFCHSFVFCIFLRFSLFFLYFCVAMSVFAVVNGTGGGSGSGIGICVADGVVLLVVIFENLALLLIAVLLNNMAVPS